MPKRLPDESWPPGVRDHRRSCYECDWTLRNDLELIEHHSLRANTIHETTRIELELGSLNIFRVRSCGFVDRLSESTRLSS